MMFVTADACFGMEKYFKIKNEGDSADLKICVFLCS